MKNIYRNIPGVIDAERIEKLVCDDHVTVERIVSRGHTSPESGWYDQQQHEWVVVLRGQAVLAFDDGTSVRLQEGDCTNIPAHRRHRVCWTDPTTETIWLAVFY